MSVSSSDFIADNNEKKEIALRPPWLRLSSEERQERKEKRKISRDKARARALEPIAEGFKSISVKDIAFLLALDRAGIATIPATNSL